MSRHHYVDNAPTAHLVASVDASSTAIQIDSATGFPTSFPFRATIDINTGSAEQVDVTEIVGTTLTIVRNVNGQGATAHASAATFNHTANAADFDEANDHVNRTSNVHGVTGTLADTTSPQTLTNKTFTNLTVASSGGVPGLQVTTDGSTSPLKILNGSTTKFLVDQNGNVTAGSITANSLTLAGNITGQSASFSGALTARKGLRTLVAWGESTLTTVEINGGSRVPLASTPVFNTTTGRAYEIVVADFGMYSSDGSGGHNNAHEDVYLWLAESQTSAPGTIALSEINLTTYAGGPSPTTPVTHSRLVKTGGTYTGPNVFTFSLEVPGAVTVDHVVAVPLAFPKFRIYVYDVGLASDYGL